MLKDCLARKKKEAESNKLEVEDYLKTYSDLENKGNLGLPPDMPPLGEVAHEMDFRPPKGKEVQEVVRRAQASSASGPNGVPDQVYKRTCDS